MDYASIILTIVKTALGFADKLMAYLSQGQLLDAGRQIQNSKNFQQAAKEVERANEAAARARASIDAHPGSLSGLGDGFGPDTPSK